MIPIPIDHWTTLRDLEERQPSPGPALVPQPKSPLKEGPRLDMWKFKYPEEFNLGENPRVRGLNIQLLTQYKMIAEAYDYLAEQEEIYAYHGTGDKYVADCNRTRVDRARTMLDECLAKAEPLLAEVSAIGGEFYMPPKLQHKVPIKTYAVAGSLEHLIGQEYFFQEELGDIVDEAHIRSLELLKLLSFKLNRLVFLQHCGVEYTETNYFRGLLEMMRDDIDQLDRYQFPFETMPALFHWVAQILGRPPLGVPAVLVGHGEHPVVESDEEIDEQVGELEDEQVGELEDEQVGELEDGQWGGEVEVGQGADWVAEEHAQHIIFQSSDEEDDVAKEQGQHLEHHHAQHIIFQSSDEDDVAEEQGQHLMQHLIFLSSDEDDEVEHDNAHELGAFENDQVEHDQAFEDDQVEHDHDDQVEQDHGHVFEFDVEEDGPRHTLFLSSSDDDGGHAEDDGPDDDWVGQDDDWVGQHLIFLSSDDDDEVEQPPQQMHHIIFLSSDEEVELDNNAQGLEAEADQVELDHVTLFQVDADVEGPRHTLILSSDDE